ncbi:hypothetical protein M3Y99_01656500 [Aphelenchoides fujianensis]|nr:hypothetical protein M3Y99_01656500 [Aphelenchoides fujianensis]
MFFVTPLLVVVSGVFCCLLVKSLSRFKKEFLWIRRTRPSRVCRTIVTQQSSHSQPPHTPQASAHVHSGPPTAFGAIRREGPFPLHVARSPLHSPHPPHHPHFSNGLPLPPELHPMQYAFPPGQSFHPMVQTVGFNHAHPLYFTPHLPPLFPAPPPYPGLPATSPSPSAPPCSAGKE